MQIHNYSLNLLNNRLCLDNLKNKIIYFKYNISYFDELNKQTFFINKNDIILIIDVEDYLHNLLNAKFLKIEIFFLNKIRIVHDDYYNFIFKSIIVE